MALLINKEFSNGVSGSYWKIGKVVWELPNKLKVYLAIYINSTTRINGKEPIFIEGYDILLNSTDVLDSSLLGVCYTKIKELPSFSGAVDC